MKATLHIDPRGYLRRTHQGRFSPAAKRYHEYMNSLRVLARAEGLTLADSFAVVFHMPMPKSWSQKKKDRLRGEPHQQKPDYSNCLKALEDALHPNDKEIWRVHGEQRWADEGSIVVSPITPTDHA